MNTQQPIYVRAADCQRTFGVHRSTLYRAAKRGEIKIHKRGSMSFVKTADMIAWIERPSSQPRDN